MGVVLEVRVFPLIGVTPMTVVEYSNGRNSWHFW